ncbi:hypothetical protein V1478_017881 [Vespula squamosa]|uniref:Uncharacterized protein n=1 Tax=Vespula squamosa TaxID=30214 RepID=A0ABD1ZVI9_VESSQ
MEKGSRNYNPVVHGTNGGTVPVQVARTTPLAPWIITASALPVIGSLPSRDCYLLPVGQVTDSTVFWCSSRTVAQIDDGANVLTEQTTRASRNIELKSPSLVSPFLISESQDNEPSSIGVRKLVNRAISEITLNGFPNLNLAIKMTHDHPQAHEGAK